MRFLFDADEKLADAATRLRLFNERATPAERERYARLRESMSITAALNMVDLERRTK